ncbi:MAG: hypothetical protein Q8N03_16005 [Ignavibacteria bacterium]|nr:hypothetical protein [Ignavibacteria bacterium]
MLNYTLIVLTLITMNIYPQENNITCNCFVILIPKNEKIPILECPNGDVIAEVINDTRNDDYVIFQLHEIKNNYAYVTGSGMRIDTVERSGWLEVKNLGIYPVDYSLPIDLYNEPSKSSGIKNSINDFEYSPLIVEKCKGQWLFVSYKRDNQFYEGWLPPDNQCSNPYTTCN